MGDEVIFTTPVYGLFCVENRNTIHRMPENGLTTGGEFTGLRLL
jgi:hypothetical protein